MGHNKEQCREWLKLTKEQQEQAEKEKSEEKARKYLQHVRCYNCNKMGHTAKDCPENKSRDSSGGSGGGFAMMCIEGVQSLVEENPKSISDEDKAQPNSEVNLEEKDSEQHLEQGLSLQEWINYEVQSTMTEEQSCMSKV